MAEALINQCVCVLVWKIGRTEEKIEEWWKIGNRSDARAEKKEREEDRARARAINDIALVEDGV